ncbi:MAG: hypothetical protein WKF59_10295 [Chitinophagaceae bacterium]
MHRLLNSPQGKLIRRNTDNSIKTIVQLSTRKDALFYFPFLDDLISGKQTIESISKYVGTVIVQNMIVLDIINY